MSFNDLVKSNMKTKAQAAQEREASTLRSAVEWNYNQLKTEIINKSSRGEFSRGIISGNFQIIDDGNWMDNVPYGNIFSSKKITNSKRSGGIIGFHDAFSSSMEIGDLAKLSKFYNELLLLAQKDGISLGEPYLRGVISTWEGRKFLKEKRFQKKFGALKGSIRYDRYIKGSRTTGEYGEIYLAVDYSYQIK